MSNDRKPRKAVVAIKWGPDDETRMPYADWVAKEAHNYVLMAGSDDPYWREIGTRYLREQSDAAAARTVAGIVNQASAKRKRKKSTFVSNLRIILRNAKRDHTQFKTLFARWEKEEIRGMTIELVREGRDLESSRYRVTDTHTKERKEYNYRSLMTMFAKTQI